MGTNTQKLDIQYTFYFVATNQRVYINGYNQQIII